MLRAQPWAPSRRPGPARPCSRPPSSLSAAHRGCGESPGGPEEGARPAAWVGPCPTCFRPAPSSPRRRRPSAGPGPPGGPSRAHSSAGFHSAFICLPRPNWFQSPALTGSRFATSEARGLSRAALSAARGLQSNEPAGTHGRVPGGTGPRAGSGPWGRGSGI